MSLVVGTGLSCFRRLISLKSKIRGGLMSSAKKAKSRTVVATLGVVANADDPSILQACVSALKGGPVDASPPSPSPVAPPPQPSSAKRTAVSADVQQLAEDAIDASLKKVIADLRKSGVEPKFDGTEWGERLIDLWRVLKHLEAEGFRITAEEIDETAGK
jgi:hypothetical protein